MNYRVSTHCKKMHDNFSVMQGQSMVGDVTVNISEKPQPTLLNIDLLRLSRNMELCSYVIWALKKPLSAVLVNEDRIIEISCK